MPDNAFGNMLQFGAVNGANISIASIGPGNLNQFTVNTAGRYTITYQTIIVPTELGAVGTAFEVSMALQNITAGVRIDESVTGTNGLTAASGVIGLNVNISSWMNGSCTLDLAAGTVLEVRNTSVMNVFFARANPAPLFAIRVTFIKWS